ncbi:hypothetical protein ACFE04_005071 [Oxalis oulophora]
MKHRVLKLREAHKVGSPSFCSILWDLKGEHIITASACEAAIAIQDALILSNPPKILRHHRDGITALSISPNSTCLASGSYDHSVKLYKFPSGDFDTNITRFTLPLRALAFNEKGTMLAAAGDDEGIKLINTIDGTIARVLKGHKESVTGIAFDPKSEYLASIDSYGTVIIWELQSGNILHNLKGVAPNTGSDVSIVNVIGWSPDGDFLAVPGLKNDVVMYDRDTAEKIFSLRGDHVKHVCYLSWSPNGKYLATAGLDRQVLIWDVDRKQDIDRQKFEDRVCCMAWKPIGNALAVIDDMGKYGVWDSVVPSSMKSPTEDIPSSRKNSNGLVFFDDEELELDEEEEELGTGLSDYGEDDNGESGSVNRKRSRKQSVYDEEYDNDEPKPESRKKANFAQQENSRKLDNNIKNAISSAKSKMQEAFQPGSTPVQTLKKRFLCYNMLGSITTLEREGYSHIEIDFHDTSRGSRVPAMTDYFGFTMASLNENGSVFANPCKGEKNMSTLMYRPFSSCASNSEWSMRFEGEEVKVVALGTSWVAAITNLNFLRIFSEGGLQKHILSLDGPVVTASGFKDELAIVTHVSDCLPSDEQMLEFRLFNVSKGTQSSRGRLPITPGSHLTWFGFSEGQLSSYDSKGMLRLFSSQFGGSWLPLFSASKVKKPGEQYWVVGLNASKLFCIVCKSPDLFPQVMPKPVLTLLDLSFPLASSDLGADAQENEFMLNNLHLSQIHKRLEEMSGAGLDGRSLDDEAFNLEVAQDRCILRLIASCCNSDKLTRATELVKLLSLEKSMKGAIQLVTALKLPNLAERFSSIVEERLRQTKETSHPPLPKPSYNEPITTNVAISRTVAPTTPVEISEPVLPSSSVKLTSPLFKKKPVEVSEAVLPSPSVKLSAPLFKKKTKAPEASGLHQTTNGKTNSTATDGFKNNLDLRKPPSENTASSFLMKPSSDQEKPKQTVETNPKPSRNPFKKASFK